MRRFSSLLFSFAALSAGYSGISTAAFAETAEVSGNSPMACESFEGNDTICADVVALDQTLVYNRFGSFNPFGMMYALRRDVVPATDAVKAFTADDCDADLSNQPSPAMLVEGNVRLRDCKRPRPLVLRANVGQVLHVRVANLLTPEQPGYSETFCRQDRDIAEEKREHFFSFVRNWVSEGDEGRVKHGEVACEQDSLSKDPQFFPNAENEYGADWPRTRGLNFAIQGLHAIGKDGGKPHDACIGLAAIEPGKAIDCYFKIDREGPYFMASTAAPSGGQGDGGSLTHGLFGAVVAQKEGANWYRSQVSMGVFDQVWGKAESDKPHARKSQDLQAMGRYEAESKGVPLLNMLRKVGNGVSEIVHSDLNAIVYRPAGNGKEEVNFREFSVFFHDELKTFYTRNFEELGQFGAGQLAGVRDGFGINYGASGMGPMLIANRKGIGPAANCVECLYEEFFLTSWANGDPALLEQYSDDPSNVHHSYLNDRVVFRNFHAGPKETHVFHLHAHQWFAGNDRNRGSYLDSQTVGPQQGFTYDIYGGGLEIYRRPETAGGKGWYDTLGSGNRNRTAGDSIFHCHLYPHFAQGMWELWRVHDVLEDGSRKLPDGQWEPTLSLAEMSKDTRARKRPGSVEHETGALITTGLGDRQLGTPVPAVVPLPGQPWPLLPTYSGRKTLDDVLQGAGKGVQEPAEISSFPGYPYYIAGKPGHRPPQPPMDIARKLEGDAVTSEYLDGGLPRHVMLDNSKREYDFAIETATDKLAPETEFKSLAEAQNGGKKTKREIHQSQIVAKALALGDMTMKLKEAELKLLPYDGTPMEVAAQKFHHDGAGLDLAKADGSKIDEKDKVAGGYLSLGGMFAVNGAPPKPGAPFADPCGAPKGFAAESTPEDEPDPFLPNAFFTADPAVTGFRRYEASAVQLDMVTNRAGWHDPQARINVLTAKSDEYKAGDGKISPKVSGSEEPFFFRALSGECIEFRHTNELPKDLELDDFQMKTPTDTIGQHIHLVKFDVTSSDGSGNGFNYEDGTFAPDEIAARICAAKNGGLTTVEDRTPGSLEVREEKGLCGQDDKGASIVAKEKIWKKSLKDNRKYFQTTVQRWFADPILSDLRAKGDGDLDGMENKFDRTLRTVFSHDHFGPSSIQQHGFYTALLIEPSSARYCTVKDRKDIGETCTNQRKDRKLVNASDKDVGARKVVIDPNGISGGEERYREFAISIADFATLYDPRDRMTPAEALQTEKGQSHKGMATLHCEHALAMDAAPGDKEIAKRMKDACGSALQADGDGVKATAGDVPPAWFAAGMPGDSPHNGGMVTGLLNESELDHLGNHLVEYRQKAAGYPADPKSTERLLAKPVAAPSRPESISVDHHDPYLVNYRGEPIPLRIGEDANGSAGCAPKEPHYWAGELRTGVKETCSINKQKEGEYGNLANVFLSKYHGDPVTPILRTIEKEPIQIRLIQGAQEVQHTFNMEGYNWPRNIDNAFPSGAPLLDHVRHGTLSAKCQEALDGNLRKGRPREIGTWLNRKPTSGTFWADREKMVASCFNAEGRVTAQEIGISEHFEFAGAYDYANSGVELQLQGLRETEKSSDTLFHFGSVDALWNGAWGLLRVHQEGRSGDLQKLAEYNPELAKTKGAADASDKTCDPNAPQKFAVAAAIEAQSIFGDKGLSYADGLRDQNGLVLSLVDPRLVEFTDPGSTGAKLTFEEFVAKSRGVVKPEATVDRTDLIEALKEQVGEGRVQPFVLPVNAGDCVHLLVVNALRDWKQSGGLLDDLGDALMPKIVPLNVEAAWSESGEDNKRKNFTSGPEATVRGSARFGLSLPLPVLTYQQSISRPFGKNETPALDATSALDRKARLSTRNRRAELLTFYAGRAIFREKSPVPSPEEVVYRILDASLPDDFAEGAGSSINQAAMEVDNVLKELERLDRQLSDATGSDTAFSIVPEERTDGSIRFMIEEKSPSFMSAIDPKILNERNSLRTKLNASISRLNAEFTKLGANIEESILKHNKKYGKYIPYAFGSLPIKSVGDMISHATHGLIGAINVVPQGAAIEAPGIAFETAMGGGTLIKPSGASGMAMAAVSLLNAPSPETPEAGEAQRTHNIRQFTLFWQDGLNFRDDSSGDTWAGYDPHTIPAKPISSSKLVADCAICDDSYDFGEKGVSYRSEPFHRRLRDVNKSNPPESHYDLNAFDFGKEFFKLKKGETGANARPPMHVLRAEAGDEVVIHVVHPGGRARQRAFVTIAQDYDDLFPGFGFPHSALLAPGKAITASLTRPMEAGCYLWFDGPTQLRAGGAWGLLDVVDKDYVDDLSVTSCARKLQKTELEKKG